MTEQKSGACSIIVRNVAPSTNPPTKKVLEDFFIFCGPISASYIIPDKDPKYGDSLTAVITFESEAAAKTAQLLSDALINDRPIVVEEAPANFLPSALGVSGVTTNYAPENNQNGEPSILSNILDNGYQLGSDVLAQAKALDEQHGVTQTLSNGFSFVAAAVTTFDTQYQISDKARAFSETVQTTAKEVDTQYEISTTATQVGQQVGQQVGGFFTAASATAITGAETAKVAIDNLVESPPVAMGIETIKSVGVTIGASLSAFFGPGTNK